MNPTITGMIVVRGWWVARITKQGIAVPIGDDKFFVPVEYSDGQHGIAYVSERVRHNGRIQIEVIDVCPTQSLHKTMLRHNRGMPEILRVTPDAIVIGVWEGDDFMITIARPDTQCAIYESLQHAS